MPPTLAPSTAQVDEFLAIRARSRGSRLPPGLAIPLIVALSLIGWSALFAAGDMLLRIVG